MAEKKPGLDQDVVAGDEGIPCRQDLDGTLMAGVGGVRSRIPG
jgi:hypothetical protein